MQLTPAISLFISCTDESEVSRLFAVLAEKGQVFRPLDAYPFSRRFAWVQDRLGVSWPLSVH
ncbi:MAG TPA: VOC family protein [Vicinamibacteria bacterium]|jgi:predicted 3-demethylubiquinone-9 3-methyltransferase (glyoxalase superfamily)